MRSMVRRAVKAGFTSDASVADLDDAAIDEAGRRKASEVIILGCTGNCRCLLSEDRSASLPRAIGSRWSIRPTFLLETLRLRRDDVLESAADIQTTHHADCRRARARCRARLPQRTR